MHASKGIVDSLDYSQQRLEEVPKEILKLKKHVEELLLNVNGIEALPPEFFRCTKLRRLDVSENKLKLLPSEIATLQLLQELNLSKNELVELPEAIGACRNLQSLNISTNIVPALPKSLVNLDQLTSLCVSNNSLTALPQDIDLLTNLQYLDASQCELRFLPPSIARLQRIKMLQLCENYITELPQGMGGLMELETLDLGSNMLASLGEDVLRCASLKTLDLSSNNLTSLPSNLGDLQNVQELLISDNCIAALPSSIGQLHKLEVLKAAKNRLGELTPAICSCSSLTDLVLCENMLDLLPSSIGNLKKLRFLDANVNNLSNIPTTIGGCSSLNILLMRHNQLKEIPMEIGRLERLSVLDLVDNSLTYLPFTLTVLYKFKTLSALWLSFNQPPLPKLSVTNEPVMNIKVLTCYLLPQKGQPSMSSAPPPVNKSCVGGARVCFAKEGDNSEGTATTAAGGAAGGEDDDEDKHLPIGRFERYDTPHPKPFAPKNRTAINNSSSQNRNSGDFTGAAQPPPTPDENGAHPEEAPPVVETRPLRSVLKRRPQSVHSQSGGGVEAAAAAAAAAAEKTSPVTTPPLPLPNHHRLIKLERGGDGAFGWNIVGGVDSVAYKDKEGIFISQLSEGGNASLVGFRVDDRLLAVNGVDLRGAKHSDAVQAIQNGGDQLEVLIERALSPPPPLPEVKNREEEEEGEVKALPRINSSREMVSVGIHMGEGGSPGFSLVGHSPVRLSSIKVGGAAALSGKLRVGDRLLSVNGVNVKGATLEQVEALIAFSKGEQLYLVVERLVTAAGEGVGGIALSRSMPSLFPMAIEGAEAEGSPFQQQQHQPLSSSSSFSHRKQRHAPLMHSMNSLLIEVGNGGGGGAFTPFHHQPSVVERFQAEPLATSSPVPTATAGVSSPSQRTSQIPRVMATSIVKAPPPVAPKPKMIPERLNFSSKIKRFEEEITAQSAGSNGKNSPAITSSSSSFKSGIPTKKPLVSSQDLEKLRAEERQRAATATPPTQQAEEDESSDAILELSNDPCFNMLLQQGSTSHSSMSGPSIIRTRKAELRAERLQFLSNSPTPSDASISSIPTPSRAGSSLSVLEQRALDLAKRQEWRQARLQSMDVESKRTEEVLKQLIESATPSPIPIQ